MIPIRQNSFFEEFNKIRIEECLEVVKCLIALNLNAKKHLHSLMKKNL